MAFYNKHYMKVFNHRAETNTRNEMYCFALRLHMGKNGRIEQHELYNQKFKKRGTNKIYSVHSVNIHFWGGGYYWFLVFIDENGSSAPRIWENINSNSGTIKNCIEETKKDFIPISS